MTNDTVILSWNGNTRMKEVNRVLDIVAWCRSQGLVVNQDFTWEFNVNNEMTIFKFITNPAYASLLKLKFAS